MAGPFLCGDRSRAARPPGHAVLESCTERHTPAAARSAARTAFRQGLISNLLNPKVAVFYLALFPQFVLPGLGTTTSQSVLASVFWLMCMMWFALVLLLLARVESLLRRRSVRRGLAGVSGVGLVGLGAALAVRG
ncbi:LysE family translocator [Streptomyces rubiginosohelvolus]|uniref:LysE family translocator n=1 Tax=Streptomyces rubiginosohelvolus TaxID=67362 RepID=UPI00379908D4